MLIFEKTERLEIKEVGMQIKALQKKNNRINTKKIYGECDPGLGIGRADVMDDNKYEVIEEASERVIKIIETGDQVEQESGLKWRGRQGGDIRKIGE